MAFRYFYQISCSSNVLGGLPNNTNAYPIRSSLNKSTVQSKSRTKHNTRHFSTCHPNFEQSNLSRTNKNTSQNQYEELVDKDDRDGSEFLTSKKYYLHDSQRSEKEYYDVNNEKMFSKEPFYLQPAKLQPYKSGSINLSSSVTNRPIFTENSKNMSTSSFASVQSDSTDIWNNRSVVNECTPAQNQIKKNDVKITEKPLKMFHNDNNLSALRQRKILKTVESINLTDFHRFYSKAHNDCDCPPSASRNLTSVDSCCITHKSPLDVPPLAPLKKRCQPEVAIHKCNTVDERTPRADDCYEVKPKQLPPLYGKKCQVEYDQLSEGKPLPPLKKRPVQESPRVCPKIPIFECPPRADDRLMVKPKTLPKLKLSDCPTINSCVRDVQPLKPLKKLYECESSKIPPETKKCDINERADSKVRVHTPRLPKTKFDFIPNINCPSPPNIPLNRLPKLEPKDPPMRNCEEVKTDCYRSDDFAPKKTNSALPTLIPKPKNDCISTCHYKRSFTSMKRKYSILSAMKNPWALSVLTANVIAFNYYHSKCGSAEKHAFERNIRKDLSKLPAKTVKKKSVACCSSSTLPLGKDTAKNESKSNRNSLKEKYRKPIRIRRRSFSSDRNRKKIIKYARKKINFKSSEPQNINDKVPSVEQQNDDFSRYIHNPNKIMLGSVPFGNTHNYVERRFSESAKSWKIPPHALQNTRNDFYKKHSHESFSRKKNKISFVIYSVNNHRTIHSSTKQYDKNDKNRKCGNKKCVKIKWPGLPPRHRPSCTKEFVPKPCKKRCCPYPSFSECGSIGDFPTCECDELPKLLQPKYRIIPEFKLLKPAPPDWSVVDADYEKKCVMEKLDMPRGEIRTCENFHCPHQHFGSEYLTEDEKECPSQKPKPPISCTNCASSEPIGSRKYPHDKSRKENPPKKCQQPPELDTPRREHPKPEHSFKPTCKKNIKNYEDPWKKKSCSPTSKSSQILRFVSTYTHNCVDPDIKRLKEKVCDTFKANLPKSCKENKSGCAHRNYNNTASINIKDISNIKRGKKENFLNETHKTTNSTSKKTTPIDGLNSFLFKTTNNDTFKDIEKQVTNQKQKILTNLNFIELLKSASLEGLPLQHNQDTSGSKILQSLRYMSTVTSVRKKSLWHSLCSLIRTNSEPKEINQLKNNDNSLKYGGRKHFCKKLKSVNNRENLVKSNYHPSNVEKFSMRPLSKIPKIIVNSNCCQLSTTSNSRKNEDNDSWKQSEKSNPDILKQVPTPITISEDNVEHTPPINSSKDDMNKPNISKKCKTPIMQVCPEARDRFSCDNSYVHPKCEPQKAPFPSFSECRPPFPKYRLSECEIQRRNHLIAKQKLQIYAMEKTKHKYCVRCGSRISKQYSTFATALNSFGFYHVKRYHSSTSNIKKEQPINDHANNILRKIKNEIKVVEDSKEELDSNSYYKILKVLDTYSEDEVYQLFNGDCNNLPKIKNSSCKKFSILKENDEIDVIQLYKNFHNKVYEGASNRNEDRCSNDFLAQRHIR